MKKRGIRKTEKNFELKNPFAVGIDIGSRLHYIAVSEKTDSNQIGFLNIRHA